MNFTIDQILSMAPDDASKKSGKELSNASKWVKKQFSERALWGECQGSGKLPYQTQIDITSVAFKCSCPSRKFPCKHGLGLLLLYANDKNVFSKSSEPDWVTGWLDSRNQREEKKTEKKEKEKKADPEAQAKRQENRLKRVEDGTSEMRLWIKDIIRNGLVSIPGKNAAYFDGMAKRMVDAQAPGLASMVRSLGNMNFYHDGWQSAFLDQLIRIYLVIEGFSRIDDLLPEMQNELRGLVGFNQNQDELKGEAGIEDEWFVLSKTTEKEEQLTTERNWLYGMKSQRFALILQFYVRGQIPEVNLVPGSTVSAELVFFKGVSSFRALVKSFEGISSRNDIEGFNGWDTALSYLTDIHAANPWTTRIPVIIDKVVPLKNGDNWLMRDDNGRAVMISRGFQSHWKLMSISGGKSIRVFALGKENHFEPLGAWVGSHYTLLT